MRQAYQEIKTLGQLDTRLKPRPRGRSATVRPVKVYEVTIHARLVIQAGSADDAARKADDVLHALDAIDKRSGRPVRRREEDARVKGQRA